MKINLGKRYNGIIPIDRNCKIDENNKFDFLFSFKIKEVLNEDDGKFIISYFNPQLAGCLLKQFPEFKFYYKENSKSFLVSATVLESKKNKVVVKFDKNLSLPEKRKYNRFKLSELDLPKFSIYFNGNKLTENARILEISLRGLQIYSPDEFSFNNETLLEVINEEENINIGLIKPVIMEKNTDGLYIRGEIKKTNINMTKFTIETYIKVAKDIIKTYCEKG